MPVLDVADKPAKEIEAEIAIRLRKGKWAGEVYAELRKSGMTEEDARYIVQAAENQLSKERYRRKNRVAFAVGSIGYFLLCLGFSVLAGLLHIGKIFEIFLGAVICAIETDSMYTGTLAGAKCGYVAYLIFLMVYYFSL